MTDLIANGIRLHYVERGSGAAMLWLHGLCASAEGWRDTMAHFADRFHVIAYDARGHGRSEIPDDPGAYSQEVMINDLGAVMDALGVGQAILGGHSMGAGVALNFALRYPERCRGLILVGIGSGSSSPKWWEKWWGKLADVVAEKGMAAAIEEMKELPAWRDVFTNPRVGKEVTESILRNSTRGIASTIRGVQQKRSSVFQLEATLKASPTATLVVMSEFDTPVMESSRFIAQCMPKGELKVLPARSHWTHLEAADQFLHAVDEFVAPLA